MSFNPALAMNNNNFQNNSNNMNNNRAQYDDKIKINKNMSYNPFSGFGRGGNEINYYDNLPKPSQSYSNNLNKRPLPKRKFKKNDKEAEEINQMYNNYDPGEYTKDPGYNNDSNNNNIFNPNYNINNKNDNTISIINELLKDYVYPGSKDINISHFPIDMKSADFYKMKIHIKSFLIPKIIMQLKNNQIDEAYQNARMILYYLSNINSKK